MKAKLLLILVIISGITSSLIAGPSPVSEMEQTVYKGNELYKGGEFEKAITMYEKVLDQGYSSAQLYYNLGNAYFKTDQLPNAILYFERALKLDPGNEDLIYNLKVANNQIVDKIDVLPQLFYKRWWNNLKQSLSPDTWAVATLILLFLIFITLTAFLLSTSIKLRKALLTLGMVLLFITGVAFIISYETYKNGIERNEAIVFAASLPVKSSPEESGIDLFVIHEGLKVEILDQLSGWREIRIANGSKGWIPSNSIVPI